MNVRHVGAAIAASCLVIPATLQAQSATHVHATTTATPVSLQQWSAQFQKSLDRTLRYPMLMGNQPFATGVTTVKFNCSDSGRPDKVTIARTSGSPALDRAAVDAVQRIVSLHPLPDGIQHSQQFRAMVVFETDHARYDERMKTISGEVTKTNAWFKGPAITAGNTAGNPAGGTGVIEIAGR